MIWDALIFTCTLQGMQKKRRKKEGRKIKSDGRCIVECLKESAKREKQRQEKSRDGGTVKEEVKILFDINNMAETIYRYQMEHEDARQYEGFNKMIETLEEMGKRLCNSVH